MGLLDGRACRADNMHSARLTQRQRPLPAPTFRGPHAVLQNRDCAPGLFRAPGKVYSVTQPTRHSLPRGNLSSGDIIEAEAAWLVPWRGLDTPHASTALNIPIRDRAATAARPLRGDAVAPISNQDTTDAEPDILIVMPSTSPQVVVPHVTDVRSSSRRDLTPISIARTLLITLMLYYALSSTLQLAGYAALPLAPFPWATTSGVAAGAAALPHLRMDGRMVTRVQPMTQMRRGDLYDSQAQFNQWAGAACSAASLAEVLTSYGLPHMTIGRMIRELGSDISPNWGLLSYNAFNKVVARYGLRADVYLSNNPLTYRQMLYLTNTLGIPVVVNMRATTGYYRYLSGGHILVMTGGDTKTIRLADSSLYYIKSLPLSTYNQMARPRNVVIVPKDYHYTLPG